MTTRLRDFIGTYLQLWLLGGFITWFMFRVNEIQIGEVMIVIIISVTTLGIIGKLGK